MNHFPTGQAGAWRAIDTHPPADGDQLALRRIEIEPAQRERIAGIVAQRCHQLPPAAIDDFAVHDFAGNLGVLAVLQIGHLGQPGLVLVAQRQVQDKIPIVVQTQTRQIRARRVAGALGTAS